MTPGARVAAAIEILGDMNEGLAAEQALTRWARRSRFAGSKDRAAIRDHVFDVLRCKRTAAHFGQGTTPRALMLGLLRQQGAALDELFNGTGHAPAPLSDQERIAPSPPEDSAVAWNLPDWLIPLFKDSLGAQAEAAARALQGRAPVCLRVNRAKTDRAEVRAALAQDGVETHVNPLCDTALTVSQGARSVRNSQAYQSGMVELQDGASQALVAALPEGRKVLDYCAGGGGKALALAAQGGRKVSAHDVDPQRMRDLPVRAARANADIQMLGPQEVNGAYDLVLCDAPCSGSGAWRRSAEGKWTLTPTRLKELQQIQDDILERAADLVAPHGTLAYATCSVLREENEARLQAFLASRPDWQMTAQKRYEIGPHGDGFFAAHLMRV